MDEPTEGAVETRIDTLLRELMASGLVEPQAPGEQEPWRLTRQAQHGLEALASPAFPADQLIYFGHHCARCHVHAATKLRDGAFVCFSCLERATSGPAGSGDDTRPPDVQRLVRSTDLLGVRARTA
ncbi:MAG: hypothetical protein ACLPVF_02885 [Acidimicrobiales bacterium]